MLHTIGGRLLLFFGVLLAKERVIVINTNLQSILFIELKVMFLSVILS